jgi:hypothetical protein
MKKATHVVMQRLRTLLELIFVGCLLVTLASSINCQAQDGPGPVSQTVDSAPPKQQDTQPEDFPPDPEDQGTDAQDLATGLPLRTLLTPFHWASLSLLSFTAYEGYNSNPESLRIPLGNYLTSLSGLVLYSSHFAGWELNAQYLPFVWISSPTTLKSFSAVSVDVRTLRRINSNWRWTFTDRFRYSPTNSTSQAPGFVAEPGGGFGIGNAFLSSGRNVLANGAAATLTDRYSENSSFVFHANQAFTRLSSYIGTQFLNNLLPVQDAITFTSGVMWRHRYSSRSAINLDYNYLVQTTTAATVADVQTHSAGVGWSHKFGNTFGLSASAGPAWSIYTQQHSMSRPSPGRTTLHGSLAISKEFWHGGATLSAARSDGFSGIISDSFQNRYDLTVFRQLTARLHCSVSASYVQQQLTNVHNTDGELIFAESRYSLSHNWSLFGQIRYLNITGSERLLAPETSVIAGFRWAWSPERP